MMRFYSMSIREVRDLPIKSFWMLHKSVDRLMAEDEMRQATVIAHSMAGGDGFTELLEGLRKAVGVIVEFEDGDPGPPPVEPLDREGLLSLKGLGSTVE